MKKLFKLLFEILRDERGGLPLIAGAVLGGSTLLGGLLGKNKKKTEVYDPYAALRGDYQTYLQGKLGTSTPYSYNPEFELEQPQVESAAESTILNRLGNLPSAEEYKGKVEASKTQQIAREKERAFKQQEEEKNMYNRLGLVSSTPWMTRAGELGEESLGRQRDIESGMDIYGLEYGLQADELANQIAGQWTGLGTTLGSAQRGYEGYAQQMSMEDLQRMINEEQQYSQMSGSLLGSYAPQVTTSYEPNTWAQLAGTGQDIGKMMLLSSILGGGKARANTV